MNGRRVDKSPTSTEATFNQPRLATIDLMRKVSAATHNTLRMRVPRLPIC